MQFDVENDEKLDALMKENLEREEIPAALLPEQMTEKLRSEKRSGIRISKKAELRILAALCACMVLVAGVTVPLQLKKNHPVVADKCFMESAGSYHKLYQQVEYLAAVQAFNKRHSDGLFSFGKKNVEYAVEEAAPAATYPAATYYEEADGAASDNAFNAENGAVHEHSDTITQVEGIAEADCVKTDGNAIYYLVGRKLYFLTVDNGKFGTPMICVPPELDETFKKDYSAKELFLVDGRAVVVYTCYQEDTVTHSYDPKVTTAVVTYLPDAEGKPAAESVTYQDGYVTATRMVGDTLYLVTDTTKHVSKSIKESDHSAYVPCCGAQTDCYIEPEDILLPDEWNEDSLTLDYTVVSLINTKTAQVLDNKAFAGGCEHVYMNNNALYVTSFADSKTRISRISYRNDEIVPLSVGTVDGNLINQYAMYEKDNAFFVASQSWISSRRINYLTSFDLEMEQLDRVEFAEGETLEAVNYDGDRAYVVTFLNTDPLFSIDISNPSKLVIDDGYQVSGYSTFLYPWNGHMLSFGTELDGGTSGCKLMMYDTDSEGKLTMVSDYVWSDALNDTWYYSPALADYKALYLEPEKNLIGVPIWQSGYNFEVEEQDGPHWQYEFFEFNEETQSFEKLGFARFSTTDWTVNTRCLSIDNVLYALSTTGLMSVDMENYRVIDRTTIPDVEWYTYNCYGTDCID